MRTRISVILIGAVLAVSACGGSNDPGLVATDAASSVVDETVPDETLPTDTSDAPAESTEAPPVTDTAPPATAEGPVDTLVEPPDDPTTLFPPIPAGEFPLDPNKPPQDYDGYLMAVLDDVQQFWRDNYESVYGTPYEELSGGIHPVYPGKEGVPGCGTPQTSFEDVEGNAFYCQLGDFVAYDDATLLPQLKQELGAPVIGVVIAHEWGHAIQARAGLFDQDIPTVYTELQADCFAGAWTAHVRQGGTALPFSDKDIKAGLAGMIYVADSPGSSSLDPSAHGSAFDRVGAFEDGFVRGAVACGDYMNNPPTPIQMEYQQSDIDITTQENAPWDDQPSCDPASGDPASLCGIFQLIMPDLHTYWNKLMPDMGDISLAAFSSDPSSVCSEYRPEQLTGVAFYCATDNTVYLDPDVAKSLYDDPTLGDFSVGYVVASAWSEAAQERLSSALGGEARVLVNDCMVGAFSRALLPQEEFNPDRDPNINTQLSPGDLDEAVKTAILIGDDPANLNEIGSAFEKIDAFRAGVLGGMAGCQQRISG